MKKKKAILLIDDDQSILRTFTRILERNRYNVDNAETGKEALEKLKEKNYDVVLIDIHLPDTDGAELLEKMSEADKMVKIIITGSPLGEHPWRTAEKGADTFLQKPISPETLLNTIAGELNKKPRNYTPAN